jgi:AraC-like DNA-binding protein
MRSNQSWGGGMTIDNSDAPLNIRRLLRCVVTPDAESVRLDFEVADGHPTSWTVPAAVVRQIRMTLTLIQWRFEQWSGSGDLLTPIDKSSEASQDDLGRTRLLPWQVQLIAEYIERHIDQRLRVGYLCSIINLTKSHFARTFKQTFRLPPHVYIMRRRIERASKLMIETDARLTEIALNCGFSDQAHLSRQFRRYTAVTPTAWRRNRKARLGYAASGA